MASDSLRHFISTFIANIEREGVDTAIKDIQSPENEARDAYNNSLRDAITLDKFSDLVLLFQGAEVLPTVNPGDSDQYIFPLSDLEKQYYGSAATVDSMATFKENFDIFSNFCFHGFNWGNMVVAGGAVLTCLLPRKPSAGASYPDLRQVDFKTQNLPTLTSF